ASPFLSTTRATATADRTRAAAAPESGARSEAHPQRSAAEGGRDLKRWPLLLLGLLRREDDEEHGARHDCGSADAADDERRRVEELAAIALGLQLVRAVVARRALREDVALRDLGERHEHAAADERSDADAADHVRRRARRPGRLRHARLAYG